MPLMSAPSKVTPPPANTVESVRDPIDTKASENPIRSAFQQAGRVFRYAIDRSSYFVNNCRGRRSYPVTALLETESHYTGSLEMLLAVKSGGANTAKGSLPTYEKIKKLSEIDGNDLNVLKNLRAAAGPGVADIDYLRVTTTMLKQATSLLKLVQEKWNLTSKEEEDVAKALTHLDKIATSPVGRYINGKKVGQQRTFTEWASAANGNDPEIGAGSTREEVRQGLAKAAEDFLAFLPEVQNLLERYKQWIYTYSSAPKLYRKVEVNDSTL